MHMLVLVYETSEVTGVGEGCAGEVLGVLPCWFPVLVVEDPELDTVPTLAKSLPMGDWGTN